MPSMSLNEEFKNEASEKSKRELVRFETPESVEDKDSIYRYGAMDWFFERVKRKTIQPYFQALDFDIFLQTPCFSGNQDLLFFAEDHGFVVRLTTADHVKNLKDDFFRRMHGFLPTPIGWTKIKDDTGSIVAALYLYAGEHLTNHKSALMHADKDITDASIGDSGFSLYDIHGFNMGYIDYSDHVPVIMSVDTDCLHATKQCLQNNEVMYQDALAEGLNPGQAYARVAAHNSVGTDYVATPYRHQDLRNAFFKAWPDADQGRLNADPEAIQDFLKLCQDKVNSERYVQKYFWTNYTNSNGVKVWRKHVSPAEREKLHPSWKKPANRI